MLLEYGNTVVGNNWKVNEPKPTGYCRIYYLHKGKVNYKSLDYKCLLQPGYAYILPSIMPYSLDKLGNEELVCTYLHITSEQYFVDNIICLDSFKNPFIYHFFQTIKEAIASDFCNFVHGIYINIWDICKNNSNVKTASEPIQKAIDYISIHISEKISITILGKISGYNPNYFISRFKIETGISPHRYIIQQRLQNAVILLKGNAPLSEIAEKTGFGDSNNFSRAFKAYFNISPSQFRNRTVIP